MRNVLFTIALLISVPHPLLAKVEHSKSDENTTILTIYTEELLLSGCFNDGYQGRNTMKINQYIGDELFVNNYRAFNDRYQLFLKDPNNPMQPTTRANLLDQPQHYAACAKAQYNGFKTRLVTIMDYYETLLETEIQGRAKFQQKINSAK